MPGVFVSYCRPCAQVAEQVAAALSSIGYDVWRDDQLPAHRAYGDVIEEKLRAAGAVVVLWSSDASQSQWVRAEADFARQAGTLVQASVDGTIPPLPFNQIQCAELSGWEGDPQSPGWRKIERSVAALVGVPAATSAGREHAERISICVLPFANMSGDQEQEYFSDGISEDITTDLSKVSALAVTARNTAFTFKGQLIDVCEVARKLNVSHVLEGSVRKAANRIRITAQLIDGASGDHLWAERYDRELDDIFGIQDEISQAIVDALKLKLLPEEKEAIESRGTSNSDAYDLYLLARQSWITGDFGDPRREEKVIRICQRAVQLDPDYAQAWALLGLAQANLRHGFAAQANADDGTAAAQRALALNPDIAEARLPIAWSLAERGQHEESNAELAHALQLSPESWEVNKETARIFYRQRRVDESARHLEKATTVMEADYHGLGMLLAHYVREGDEENSLLTARRTIDQVEKVLTCDPDNGAALAFGATSLAILGNMERAREWIERGLLVDPENLMMRYNFAWSLIKVFGEPSEAIEMLAPVLANAGPNIIRLAANDPNLDSIRDQPRFKTMMDKACARFGIEPIGVDCGSSA